MTTLIAVNGLSKRFGHNLAVDNISFSVARSEVLGFLGPNGSGKSTTMKMITGFLTPTSGDAKIADIDVLTCPIEAQRRMGYLAEGAPAYADISVNAFLKFIAEVRGLYGNVASRAIDHVVERTLIGNVLDQSFETLSKGYKRRVGLAQSLLHDPDVLILDEPTDGLDPNQKHEVRNLIREIAADKAIIVSTHILEEVEAICDRAIIIANGRIKADATPREFEQRSRYFNAISLALDAGIEAKVRNDIVALPGIKEIEQVNGNDNRELIVFPEKGADILSTIASYTREHHLPVKQLQVRRGDLDEVFRNITIGEKTGLDSSKFQTTQEQSGFCDKGNSKVIQNAWTICKRELLSYFSTPIAYIFIVIFLVAIGAFTFFPGGFFEQGQANLEVFFQFHPWLYLFLVPAISMRLWAEERKSGSIELLLTLPVTTFSAVLGKYIAAWIVAGAALLLTATIWFTVNYLGSPDNGAIFAGYLGSLFVAGGYLAIGAFVSSTTKNQVNAFVVTAALCFVFTASGLSVVLNFFSSWAPQAVLNTVSNFSFLEHFRNIAHGVIDVRDGIFVLSTIAFFLFANVVVVEYKKNA